MTQVRVSLYLPRGTRIAFPRLGTVPEPVAGPIASIAASNHGESSLVSSPRAPNHRTLKPGLSDSSRLQQPMGPPAPLIMVPPSSRVSAAAASHQKIPPPPSPGIQNPFTI